MSIIDKYLVSNGNNGIAVDRMRRYVLPYWLGFDKINFPYPYSVPASPALGQSVIAHTNNTLSGSGSSFGTPFLAKYLMFQDSSVGSAAAIWTLRMKHMNGRDYMNNMIHIRALAGTAKLPFVIREHLMLLSEESIYVETQKISGAAANMRLFLGGEQYFPDSASIVDAATGAQMKKLLSQWKERSKYVYPFWMTTGDASGPPPLVVAGSATVQTTIKIGDHYEVFSMTVISTGDFSWDITETRTGQTLSNGRATGTNALGDATYPTIFPFSYLLVKGSQLKITLVDTSGSSNNIYLCFQGRKILAPLKDLPEIERQLPGIKSKIHPMWNQNQLVNEAVGEMQ